MGGKPRKTPVRRRPSTKCICGHKKAAHEDGKTRCSYRQEDWSEDKTYFCETICICQEFRSISTHPVPKATTPTLEPLPNQDWATKL